MTIRAYNRYGPCVTDVVGYYHNGAIYCPNHKPEGDPTPLFRGDAANDICDACYARGVYTSCGPDAPIYPNPES